MKKTFLILLVLLCVAAVGIASASAAGDDIASDDAIQSSIDDNSIEEIISDETEESISDSVAEDIDDSDVKSLGANNLGDGTTIYVSKTGDDSNDGSSEENAVATIAKGYELAGDGSTINIGAGTYDQSSSISIEKSVTFNGADGTIINRAGTAAVFSNTESYDLNPNLYNEESHDRIIEEVRLDFESKEDTVTYNEESVKRENKLIKPVGLALGTYLIAEDEETMYMFDIHAADERYNYERIVEEMKSKKIYTTNMLFPLELEYSHNEFMMINEHIEDIRSLGIGVDEFGKNTFRVYSHPSWIKEGFEDESIRKIFDLIMEFKGKFDRVKFNDAVAASVACKASVKANTRITFEEMEKIIENLFTCKFPYTCPHGRPTHIKYPKYELEKMFKRVNFGKVNIND